METNGWGFPEFKEFFDAIQKEQNLAIQVASEEREKAADALREQLTERIQNGDTNLREHIAAQIGQLQQMVVHTRELSDQRHVADQEAIKVAQESTKERFKETNNWRTQYIDRERQQKEQVNELSNKFLDKEVYTTAQEGLNKRIAELEAINRYEAGRHRGMSGSLGAIVTSIGVALTIITIVIVLANVLTGK